MIILIFIYSLIFALLIAKTNEGAWANLTVFVISLVITTLDPALIVFGFLVTQGCTDVIVELFHPYSEKHLQTKGIVGWLIGGGSLTKWIGWIPSVILISFGLIVSLIEYLT